jgi:hypothetical protein
VRLPLAPLVGTRAGRKSKQLLLTEGIARLQKQLKKGKGVNKVIIEERQRQVGVQAARSGRARATRAGSA